MTQEICYAEDNEQLNERAITKARGSLYALSVCVRDVSSCVIL